LNLKLKHIAITGPESTGKSSIARNLAHYYNARWVPEYAREYIDTLSRPYVFEDILNIAKGQQERERLIQSETTGLIFYDTELTVTMIWSDYKFRKCDPWIVEQYEKQDFDLYLLMDIDLPWQPDPQREHPDKRKELFELYRNELERLNRRFTIVSGEGEERIQNAIRAIENRNISLK